MRGLPVTGISHKGLSSPIQSLGEIFSCAKVAHSLFEISALALWEISAAQGKRAKIGQGSNPLTTWCLLGNEGTDLCSGSSIISWDSPQNPIPHPFAEQQGRDAGVNSFETRLRINEGKNWTAYVGVATIMSPCLKGGLVRTSFFDSGIQGR